VFCFVLCIEYVIAKSFSLNEGCYFHHNPVSFDPVLVRYRIFVNVCQVGDEMPLTVFADEKEILRGET
jgi:hypothetical protein